MVSIAIGQKAPLRPLDVGRDLPAVADLIDACFSHAMDPDGLEYVRQIRLAAREAAIYRYLPGVAENTSVPLHGYVWEEDGKIIGNLTLIPHRRAGHLIYTIANVGVLPPYRQRGIARELTLQGIEHARRHKATAVWLQVRPENDVAYRLYHSLGFVERARRTSWLTCDPYPRDLTLPRGVFIQKRISADWDQQFSWLGNVYPPEVIWNVPLNRQRLRPGLWRAIERFLGGEEIHHWVAIQGGERIGMLTWEPTQLHADHLWLATTPERQNSAIRALLPYAQRELGYSRALLLNYPMGQAVDAFRAAGFAPQISLVWMQILFDQ